MAIIRSTAGTDTSSMIPEGESYETFETLGVADDAMGNLPQDPNEAPRALRTQTYELGDGDSTELIDVRHVHNLIAVTDGTAKWEVPSEDGSFYDFHVVTSQSATATAANVGSISGDVMPPKVRLTDTSGSANTVTIYAKF